MIKKFLALFIAVLMVMSLLYPIAVSKVAKANSSTVLISEFQVGGTSGGSDEFIEFYNASDNDVDVSGWKVMYLSASGTTEYTRYTFPQNTIIPAHKHYLITNSNGYSGSVPGDGTYSQGLAKSGGGIGLRDNNGTLIDSVGYGSATNAFVEGNAAPKPSYGESDERKPGGSAGNGTDTDNNADDFFVQNAPNPQNLDSPPTPPLNNNDADLTIKVTGPAKATIGDPNSFEYTIEYKNIGASDAEGVSITDTFPAGVTYKSDDSGITPTVSGNEYVWNIGTVSAGTDVTFHINATVDDSVTPGTVLTNNVSISTTSTESNTGNNSSSCDITATDIWPIKDARGITDSTKTVKVQGNVVLTPGTLDSSDKEMYIQDETGGIDVYYSSGGIPDLQLGDRVTVSGTISSYHNKIQIKPTSVSDVTFNDYGGFVVPQTVTSSDISDHLGTLVYISGTVSDKGSSSFKVNGVKVYIDGDTGIDISGVNDGDTVTVVGIAEQCYSDYEILPRYQYDIAKTAVTPIGVARGLSSNTPVTIQGVVTSGEVFSGGKAFFVQDGTGGIEVYGVSGLNISEGDLIEVTGETSVYNGLKQSKISDSSAVTQQGFTGISITPKLDDTGKIDSCRESLLVKVEGVVSGAHSSYFYINDGSGSIKVYDSSSEVSFSDVSDGDNLIIVGIVGEYKGTVEIFPRTQDDIIFNKPCVVSTVPDNNATNVDVNTTISATFDRDMNSSTITTSTFTLKDSSGNAISGAVSYDLSSKTAIFTPSDPLSENETYTATISGTVKDTDGNAMGSDYSWSFSTGTPQVITIAEARTKSEGDVVYVEGNVTVKPGTFNKGFAIQDATGGIYVYNTGSIENFNLGDDVKVKGTLKSFNGLLEISADNADIEFVSSGTVPAPKIEQTGSVGESTEGLLIEISGTVESVSGSSFTVNDGTGAATVYIDSDTGISIAGMEVGDSATIIGFSSQYDTAAPYDSGYQVMPRMQSDISFEEVPVY
ncbi:MAG: Ig-like domain-containing protein, partial [Caldisericaceae bacterium]|nr:Ig-like domain-containing protein [Caldisericaceae bacterium]